MFKAQNCFDPQINAQEQERREAERDQTEVDELDTAVGFSRVIRKISASKKLVVGHNMLLDICFTLNQVQLPLNIRCSTERGQRVGAQNVSRSIYLWLNSQDWLRPAS
jgi:hypothetical protein